jgi:membrane fusion protein (multidrug efflux system)
MSTATQQDVTRPAEQPAPPPAAEPDRAATSPAAPSGGGGGSRRKFVLPLVALLVLLGIGWGLKQWIYGRSHATTDNAQVDGHIIPVLAKVGGYVQSVSVGENDPVTEGRTIVQVDPSEYRVRAAQAEADYAAAQATAGSGAGIGQAEASVENAAGQRAALEAQVAAAEANAQRAQADLARARELADKQIISRQQLDAAQATSSAAAAQVTAARRQASAAGAGVQNAQAGVRLAQARLQAAQAARENAALQLEYTTIKAPTTGHVSRKAVEVGQLVQPGQTLLSIVPDTGVWVTANFKETQLADIRVGQRVDVEVDAYGGQAVEGTVESISGATGAKFALLPPDNATGNFTKVVQRVPVRIRIVKGLSPDRPLRPGMSVNVSVHTK